MLSYGNKLIFIKAELLAKQLALYISGVARRADQRIKCAIYSQLFFWLKSMIFCSDVWSIIACIKLFSGESCMSRRSRGVDIDSSDILNRMETLISGTDNRYRITVEVAKRAKLSRKHAKDKDHDDTDSMPKPVLRAIIELSDKMMQPQVLAD